VRVLLELVERNKLDNVCSHILTECVRIQRLFVTVEGVHVAEVGIANTNDNDSKREIAASNDLVNRLWHVIYDTVSD
jgi:hypothetical protein